jgi:hypothetical protein
MRPKEASLENQNTELRNRKMLKAPMKIEPAAVKPGFSAAC